MYEMERSVHHCDAGADGLLKLDTAVAMLLDCCQFQEYAETAFRDWLRRHDTAVFLAYMQLDLLRRPAFREKVKVKVVIYDCKGIYGFRRITMRDAENRLLMIANAIGCFFNFSTGKAVKLPDDAGGLLTIDPAEPMETLPRKIAMPAAAGTPLAPFTVMRSDLDLNNHLASSRYLAAAADRLPEDFRCDRVRIEFKRQVKCGEEIRLRLFRETPDTILVKLSNAAGLPNALVEFSRVPGGFDFPGK